MRFLSTDKSWLGENSKQILFCIRCETHSHPNPPKRYGNGEMYKTFVYSTEMISCGDEGRGIHILELYAIAGRPKWM